MIINEKVKQIELFLFGYKIICSEYEISDGKYIKNTPLSNGLILPVEVGAKPTTLKVSGYTKISDMNSFVSEIKSVLNGVALPIVIDGISLGNMKIKDCQIAQKCDSLTSKLSLTFISV